MFKLFYEEYEAEYGNLVEEKTVKFLDMDKKISSILESYLDHIRTVTKMIFDKKNTFQDYASLELFDEIIQYCNLVDMYVIMIFSGRNDKKLLISRIEWAHRIIALLKHEKVSIKNDDMISYFISQWNKIYYLK